MGSKITILKAGIFTTIQDEGRAGYSHLGIPQSGALDKKSYHLANALLNNTSKEAVFECTLVGPQIQFNGEATFVITGATATATLDEIIVRNGIPAFAKAGQILSISKISGGARCYLAFAGGILTDLILESRSWYKPITFESFVKKGMIFTLGKSRFGDQKAAVIKNAAHLVDVKNQITKLKAARGPEYKMLSITQRQLLENTLFTVSALWDRMAIQTKEKIENNLQPIYTSPVIPGMVQLTPSGTLIILLNDCQTTGGYPRVVVIESLELNKLAQMQQGDQFLLSIA